MDHDEIIQAVFDGCRPQLERIGTQIAAEESNGVKPESIIAIASALLSMAVDAHCLVGGTKFAAQCLYAAADKLATKKEHTP